MTELVAHIISTFLEIIFIFYYMLYRPNFSVSEFVGVASGHTPKKKKKVDLEVNMACENTAQAHPHYFVYEQDD